MPLDTDWYPDLERIAATDADRGLLLWLNDPANPTGASMGAERVAAVVAWGAAKRGIVVAGDECYAEFSYGDDGKPAEPTTVLQTGLDGVLAVHSLSKRSNMAGLRVGFVAGDPDLVTYLGEVRRHAGLMVASPVQAAAAAALGDDAHVDEQRTRYAERRTLVLDALATHGFVHDGGPSTFYLWLRGDASMEDGWELAARFAHAGTLVAPGDLYGPAGADHVRLSLTQPLDRLELLVERIDAAAARAS